MVSWALPGPVGAARRCGQTENCGGQSACKYSGESELLHCVCLLFVFFFFGFEPLQLTDKTTKITA
jgi:hypothetical protein